MSDLPPGWEWSTLDEVSEIQGGIQKQVRRRPVKNRYPFLRVANVPRGYLNLSEVHEIELFEGELERYRVEFGDLLIVEGNGSLDQLGRAAMWRGQIPDCVHQNHLIRARPSAGIEPLYLAHLWNSPVVTDQLRLIGGSTSGLHTLSVSKLRPIRVPLPPAAEQQRIVAMLEDHLSRLDAAQVAVESARRNLARLHSSWLQEVVSATPTSAWTSLGEHALDSEYGTSTKCTYSATGLPVLRIPNIQSGRVELSDIKFASVSKDELSRLKVRKGDLLIVRTNGARKLIGRAAVVPTDMDFAFASYLIRYKLESSKLLPEWVQICMESPQVRQQIEELSASSAGQYNLSIAKLNTLKLPAPEIEMQCALVERYITFKDGLERMGIEALTIGSHLDRLRQGLLTDAFAGRLAHQDPRDEPASALLERLRADRAAAQPARRRRAIKKPEPSA